MKHSKIIHMAANTALATRQLEDQVKALKSQLKARKSEQAKATLAAHRLHQNALLYNATPYQLRYIYGQGCIFTPRLDQLAGHGIHFDGTYYHITGHGIHFDACYYPDGELPGTGASHLYYLKRYPRASKVIQGKKLANGYREPYIVGGQVNLTRDLKMGIISFQRRMASGEESDGEESDGEEEPATPQEYCHAGEHYVDAEDMWPDLGDCMGCTSAKERDELLEAENDSSGEDTT